MTSEWQQLRIGDLGLVVTGKTPPTSKPEFYGNETPFLTPSDMDGRRIIDKTLRYLSAEGVAKVRFSLIPQGSVSVSCIGSDMGKAVLTDRDTVTNQQINSVVVGPSFDNLFVYYNLSGRKAEIQFLASGAAQPIMNKTGFSNLPINVPNISTQKAIASVLGALDDKIENNRRMNATLEQMSRALFKSWFVDFDPVKAKMAVLEAGANADDAELAAMSIISSKSTKELAKFQQSHPDNYRQLAQTASLFPSAFGDDALPTGWKTTRFGDEFDFTMGQSPPGNTYNEYGVGIPFWQGRRDFGFRFPSNRVFCTAPTRFANTGDTLVSVRAPVGDVNLALEKSCIGRGVAAIMHRERLRSYTYYTALQLKEQFQVHKADGTVFGENIHIYDIQQV